MYGLSLQSGPASEPVELADLKAWLRLEHSSDDALITALGVAARRSVERETGRQLVTATWLLTLDGFPWPGGWAYLEAPRLYPDPHTILLPRPPLQSVTSVQYYDLANTLQTLASTVYDVDTVSDPGRIALAMNQVWPVIRLRPGAVRITFVSGYGAAAAVPETLKLAIKLTVASWYEHRGEDNHGEDLPVAAKRLCRLEGNGMLEYGI